MKQCIGLLICLAILLVTGCGTNSPASPPPPPFPNLAGNWQIQSGPLSTSPVALGVVLLGALQNTGTQVTGAFRFSNLAQPLTVNCLNQVITVTGTVDASSNLSLTSAALPDGSVVTVQLLLPAVLTSFATGTIAVSGKSCLFTARSAIADEIASVSGSFTGPLVPLAMVSPTAPAGSATLTLTQSSTPAADGEYPVSGTVSGVGLSLTATPASPQLLPNARLNSTVNPNATFVNVSELLFAPFPCATSPLATVAYNATLAKQ